MDEDLLPIRRVTEMLGRHLRLPAGWDDAERQEFVDEAAEQVALRVAELADEWADRAVTEWAASTGAYPTARHTASWFEKPAPRRW